MVPLPMALIKCHKKERTLYLQTYRYRPVKQIREDTATNIMEPVFLCIHIYWITFPSKFLTYSSQRYQTFPALMGKGRQSPEVVFGLLSRRQSWV